MQAFPFAPVALVAVVMMALIDERHVPVTAGARGSAATGRSAICWDSSTGFR
jgi:hypothetical protein